MQNYLIDSHCHLDYFDFSMELDQVIYRAKKAGIKKILTICTEPEKLSKIIQISENYKNIFFSVGLHPLSVSKGSYFSVSDLIEISKHPKMIGIGETGLDYFYSKDNKEEQIKNFEMHIKASQKTKIPLIVHSRSADDDMIKILLKNFKKKEFNCVMHCFSSGEKLAKAITKLNFYISLSGIITFKKSLELRKVIKNVPKNLILLETDSPYLSPVPLRGKKNEPSHLIHTCNYLSDFLGINNNEFKALTTSNFYNLFKKAKKYEKEKL
tara:strand:+ start:335 stop:1138 length:804 start_codon:yes stop_codon:yes gene_type:complete